MGIFTNRKAQAEAIADDVGALLEATANIVERLKVPQERVNEMMPESEALSIFEDAVGTAAGWARLEANGQFMPYSRTFLKGLSGIIFGLKEGEGSHVVEGAEEIIRCSRQLVKRGF